MNYKLPKEAGTVGNLLDRFDEAKKRKEHWVSLLQEAYDYCIPHRETFYKHNRGQKRTDHIFDSTAVEATKEFVSRIQSTVIPPWRDWTRLMPGAMLPKEVQEDLEVQEQLDDATKIFFTYLNHSNFALQSAEALMDYAVSTGCLLFEEGDDDNPFSFKAIPLAEVYPEEGPTTLIETVWREHEPLIRNIQYMYPDPDMGEDLKKKAKDSPSARCRVIEGTVHVPELEEPYIAVAIELKTKRLLWSAQYKTTPWIVFRSPTVPGELLGRGPCLDILSDVKTANKMVELVLRRASYSVSGVYTAVADGVLNPYTMKLSPGTVIPVGSNDTRNPSIGLLPMGGEPDFSMLVLDELRRNIKRALFNNLRTAEGPVKTATEISIDNRELLEYMGASFGRLQTEFVERIVKRGVDILVRRGLIPPMKINGTEITLQHTSPLARAQDFEEIENIERFIALIGQLGPEAIQQNIQIHELGRAIGKRLGVDTDLLVSEEEQEERREAQEEATAAMMTGAAQGMVQQ